MAEVYLHRKPIDYNPYYVGISSNSDRSKHTSARSEHWKRVYKKYGRIIEVVASDIRLEDAKELEIFLIQEIGIDNLCNHTLGGEGMSGYKHSKETLLKMSKAQKGRIVSIETRKKISKANMGHPNYLKSQSKEVRIKISKAVKGRKHSKESISKMKLKHANTKPNYQACMKGVKSRQDNGIIVIEINSGIKDYARLMPNHFNITKRLVYSNIKTNKEIISGISKGLNFKLITQ